MTTADIPGDHDNFNESSAKHIERVQSNTIETIEAATKAKTAHQQLAASGFYTTRQADDEYKIHGIPDEDDSKDVADAQANAA